MPAWVLNPLPEWKSGDVTSAMMNAQIKQPIEEIRTVLTATPWVLVPLSAGWSATQGPGLQVRYLIGQDMVQMRGSIVTTGTLTDSTVQVGQLPSGMEPQYQTYTVAVYARTLVQIMIDGGGGVNAYCANTGQTTNGVRFDGVAPWATAAAL